ncbi:hypothetical protein [Mesomycoplasma ovipneumoniae]|uniref:hypothetical protein n=1 Tax=Mesomycoplasma ovipneumoniae TaxID=29562 RepID=UPI00083E8F9A|nr:hypothetical protein [Mesomycoplasma ovipneumoniae]
MLSIIKLEIQNLINEDKKDLIEIINESEIQKNDSKNLDQSLENYFLENPYDFIAFQKGFEIVFITKLLKQKILKI